MGLSSGEMIFNRKDTHEQKNRSTGRWSLLNSHDTSGVGYSHT